jgi:multidrug efflux pump subunit AcrA (membrane-fusion protein)
VRDFTVTVQNAIAEERSFRARLPGRLKEAEAELAELRADTGAVDTARERLARLRELNRRDPRREAARAALEEAREDWRKLTGRLPPG